MAEEAVQPQTAPVAREGARAYWRVFWRARALWLGLTALGCALYGQKVLVESRDIVSSTRWYALGILLMLVAWVGTYLNKEVLLRPAPAGAQRVGAQPAAEGTPQTRSGLRTLLGRRPGLVRYAAAFLAFGANILGALLIRGDAYSVAGSITWVLSLALLLAAFWGYRPYVGVDADAGIQDVEDTTDLKIPRKLEIALAIGIIALGFALRFYRLGDWGITSMHADEGYAGTEAMGILTGNPVSPFLFGWFAQSNFYYWCVAAGIKLFGQDLLGLRMFSALAGSLMLVPFYPLVRMWFGVRAALIATTLLAFSAVALQLSREEFSNSMTPLLLVAGFYFLFKGIRSGRVAFFVAAGYTHVLSLYFYAGGRLTPILLGAVIFYLFVLLPVVRLPGRYREMREVMPHSGRGARLAGALRLQIRGVLAYGGHLVALALACIAMATPWLVYYMDHNDEMSSHANGVFVFSLADQMAGRYGLDHSPLYLGVRMPRADDLYPVLPVAFEQTALSVKLADDGFWPRVLWRQTTAALSILTLNHDTIEVYALADRPITLPIEASLVVLGLAWALWRWRDPRWGVLSMWFWAVLLAGGTLTEGAPNMPRMVGMIPVIATVGALTLNKLVAEGVNLARRIRIGSARLRVGTAHVLTGAAVVVLLAYLGLQNYDLYFVQHPALGFWGTGNGQAWFVRDMDRRIQGEGRPAPLYYDFSTPVTWWGDGANRFINYKVEGYEMLNPTEQFPVTTNGDRDVVFMIWPGNERYLPIIQAYYPHGELGNYGYSKGVVNPANPLLRYYLVRREEIAARQTSIATYTGANGATVQAREPGLGNGHAPAEGLQYPVRANWRTGLAAPGFGMYKFRLSNGAPAQLVIDGLAVLTTTKEAPDAEGQVILARGTHEIQLNATFADKADSLSVAWGAGTSPFMPVGRNRIIDTPTAGLTAEVRYWYENPYGDPPDVGLSQRRVDPFLSFLGITDIIGGGTGFVSTWTGTFRAPADGDYAFSLTGVSGQLKIDDKVVMERREKGDVNVLVEGTTHLTAGPHPIAVRFAWNGGPNPFQLSVTPPGGQQQLLGPELLGPPRGAWLPGTIPDPPPFDMPAAEAGP